MANLNVRYTQLCSYKHSCNITTDEKRPRFHVK